MSRFRAAIRTVSAAVGVAVLCAACAAGQHAATAEEKPTLDGTQGHVGKMQLEGVAFRSPTPGKSYPAGAAVPLIASIVNNGQTADRLVRVSSSEFPGGWNVVSTPSTLAGPSSAASAPANGTTNGRPVKIGSGLAVSYGLQNLSPSGAGSPESIVLLGWKGPDPLFPGMSVKVTFSFANAGDTTLTVPVQLTDAPNGQTLPEQSGAPAD